MLKIIVGILFSLVLIVLIIFSTIQRFKAIEKCENNGGTWIKYDCITSSRMKCYYDAKNRSKDCYTESYDTCSEKCIGARAEGQ